jgi:hypothetical protein
MVNMGLAVITYFGLILLAIFIVINISFKLIDNKQPTKPILEKPSNRVEQIYFQNFRNDKSFTEKPGWGNTIDYKHQRELRNTWELGIKTGIETGLCCASLEGQKIELTYNTTNPKHIQFLDKHYALCCEYGVAIQYHPVVGMCIINRKYEFE